MPSQVDHGNAPLGAWLGARDDRAVDATATRTRSWRADPIAARSRDGVAQSRRRTFYAKTFRINGRVIRLRIAPRYSCLPSFQREGASEETQGGFK
jgi:hypothetical protein